MMGHWGSSPAQNTKSYQNRSLLLVVLTELKKKKYYILLSPDDLFHITSTLEHDVTNNRFADFSLEILMHLQVGVPGNTDSTTHQIHSNLIIFIKCQDDYKKLLKPMSL